MVIFSKKGAFICSLLTTVAFFFLTSPLKAEESQPTWYLGVGGGVTEIENDIQLWLYPSSVPHSFDERDAGFKIFGGYQLRDWLGIEAAYLDFGQIDLTGNAGLRFTTSSRLWTFTSSFTAIAVKARAISLGVVISIPTSRFTDMTILRDLSSHFKIGGQYRNVEVELSANSGMDALARDDWDLDWFYGAGLTYQINQTFAVRLEYEHYNFQKVIAEDAELISASLMACF